MNDPAFDAIWGIASPTDERISAAQQRFLSHQAKVGDAARENGLRVATHRESAQPAYRWSGGPRLEFIRWSRPSLELVRPWNAEFAWFFAHVDGVWHFSTCLQRLAQVVKRRLAPAAIADLAQHDFVLPPLTQYQGILAVPAGFSATLAPDGTFGFEPLGKTAHPFVLADGPITRLAAAGTEEASPQTSPQDEVLRALVDITSFAWTVTASPIPALIASFLKGNKGAGPIVLSDEFAAPSSVGSPAFRSALKPYWRWRVDLNEFKRQDRRAAILAKLGMRGDDMAALHQVFVVPEWRRMAACLGRLSKRQLVFECDLGPDWKAESASVQLARDPFDIHTDCGTNLYVFAMDRLFYAANKARGPRPFRMHPSYLGSEARRLNKRADNLLVPPIFAGLTIDYLYKFDTVGRDQPRTSTAFTEA